MRNPVIIQKRWAMSKKQKYQILSNELVRRMSNMGKNETKEKMRVINEYTVQLKTSGYNYQDTQEIIKSGYIGLKRRKERRKREGLPYHREGYKTLEGRVRKKVMDRKTWYKKEMEDKKKVLEIGSTEVGRNLVRRKRRTNVESKKETVKEAVEIKSVIFVQETKNSELVRRLRESEEKMAATSEYRIKFVEKCGEKMVDVLVKSNPWKGRVYKRGVYDM